MFQQFDAAQFDVDIITAKNDLDLLLQQEMLKPYYENRILLNLRELREDADKIMFKRTYIQRPDLVSYEHLGLIHGTWVIMVVNKVSSILRFTPEETKNEILVPKYNKIETLFE